MSQRLWSPDCTFLCRIHGGDRAEGPLPSVVVRAHFHIKRREGRDGVVAEDVARHAGRGDDGSRPRDRAHWPEGDDVAEALSVLQFLWHRLGAKHKTIVILKRIQTKAQTGPSLHCTSTRLLWLVTASFFAFTTQNTPQSPFFYLIFSSCMAM